MSFVPRLDALPAPQRVLWPELAAVPRCFVLYGGTGLALRLAHRESVDFDFFSNEKFAPKDLLESLPALEGAKLLDSKVNTLTVLVQRNGPVKLSFFGGLGLNRVRDPEETEDEVLQVASLLDIAAAKMNVILGRSESKDYLDVEALLRNGISLSEQLAAARAIHGDFNPAISLRALGYFEDGDLKTLPASVKERLARAAGETCAGDIPAMESLPGLLPGKQ